MLLRCSLLFKLQDLEEEDNVASICVYPLVLVAEAVVSVVAEGGRVVLVAEGVLSADSAAVVVNRVVAMVVVVGLNLHSHCLRSFQKHPCMSMSRSIICTDM